MVFKAPSGVSPEYRAGMKAEHWQMWPQTPTYLPKGETILLHRDVLQEGYSANEGTCPPKGSNIESAGSNFTWVLAQYGTGHVTWGRVSAHCLTAEELCPASWSMTLVFLFFPQFKGFMMKSGQWQLNLMLDGKQTNIPKLCKNIL